MYRFRKKPVVIEAMQLDGTTESSNHVLAWIGKHGEEARRVHATRPADGIFIRTLEGLMLANAGDWIIKGLRGEFYPCKPDIFAATYEPAE